MTAEKLKHMCVATNALASMQRMMCGATDALQTTGTQVNKKLNQLED